VQSRELGEGTERVPRYSQLEPMAAAAFSAAWSNEAPSRMQKQVDRMRRAPRHNAVQVTQNRGASARGIGLRQARIEEG
jgi:hypothetical protein